MSVNIYKNGQLVKVSGGGGNIATTSSVGVVKPDGSTIVIDSDGTIHAKRLYSFPQDWVIDGGLDPDEYYLLSTILADEVAIRRLFTIHRSVDHLIEHKEEIGTDNLTTLLNNDYVAKWINLRDYALDTLYADSDIAAIMDTADKYFYGEWALMPQVPVMTSDTVPYGEVVYNHSSFSTYPAYHVFDEIITGTGNSGWGGITYDNTALDGYIGYKFTRPIYVSEVVYIPHIINDNSCIDEATIIYSDDGSTWYDASERITGLASNAKNIIHTNNNIGTHLYWALGKIKNNGNPTNVVAQTIQFYTWQPKGNIPVMTGNGAPYGEVKCSSYYYHDPYKVFANNPGNFYWRSNVAGNEWIMYIFANPVCVRRIAHINNSSIFTPGNFKLQGSNDGKTFSDLLDFSETENGQLYHDDVQNDDYYLYYRIYTVTGNMKGNSTQFRLLQFYGRELKPVIPNMTGDNSPCGVASSSGNYAGGYRAYEAFGYNNHAGWTANTSGTQWVQYKFTQPVKAEMVKFGTYNASSNIVTVQGSKDGTTFVDLVTVNASFSSNAEGGVYSAEIPEGKQDYYLYYRWYSASGTAMRRIYVANMFIRDVSEYDWDTDNPKHYIYDHGTEIDTITGGTRGEHAITLSDVGTVLATVDTTDYTLAGGKTGLQASGTNALKCGSASSNFIAYYSMPYGDIINITSVNGSNAVGVEQTAQGTFEIEEVWLA